MTNNENIDLSSDKDRRYFAELLIEIEKNIDVNSLVARDVKLWPLVRWQLASGIKSVQSESSLQRKESVRKKLVQISSQAGYSFEAAFKINLIKNFVKKFPFYRSIKKLFNKTGSWIKLNNDEATNAGIISAFQENLIPYLAAKQNNESDVNKQLKTLI